MAQLHVTDIEAAINYWRNRGMPAPSDAFGPELGALTTVYAQMAFDQALWVDEKAMSVEAHQAWLVWYHTTPDTPCIAICSTSQGDEVCKGCGRLFEEVQHWPAMTPVQKRGVWIRITQEGTSLRFNRYSDRAGR